MNAFWMVRGLVLAAALLVASNATAQKAGADAGAADAAAPTPPTLATQIEGQRLRLDAATSAPVKLKLAPAVQALGRRVDASRKDRLFDPAVAARDELTRAGLLAGRPAAEVDALVFLALSQAANDAQNEADNARARRDFVLQVKACKGSAHCIKQLRRPPSISLEELATMTDQAKDKVDSLSEMGEMESLRLQMAMDRKSKMMSTLSNLLKKSSETSSSIIQNIK